MDKDVTNNIIDFDVRDEREAPPRGYKEMTAHMIINIKLDARFTCKDRFFADIHKFDTPPKLIYEPVVSRNSVCIVLILSALNGLDMKSEDVQK